MSTETPVKSSTYPGSDLLSKEFTLKFSALSEQASCFLRGLDLEDTQENLKQACSYSIFSPGKRLRPILVLASAEFSGLDKVKIKDFLLAIELLHVSSLIHDDLPALDNDALRRGQPTLHMVYGEGLALLAGDTLISKAFQLLARSQNLSSEEKVILIDLLSSAFLELCQGQAIDIDLSEKDKKDLLLCHLKKTAALIQAAVLSAILIADFQGAEKTKQQIIECFRSYGRDLGLLFQITDDILDVISETSKLGKEVGSDAARKAQTYVSVYGLEGAKKLAIEHHKKAQQAIFGFGERASFFLELADFVLSREK